MESERAAELKAAMMPYTITKIKTKADSKAKAAKDRVITFHRTDAPSDRLPPLDCHDDDLIFTPLSQPTQYWRDKTAAKIAFALGQDYADKHTIKEFPKGYRFVQKIPRQKGRDEKAKTLYEIYCDPRKKYGSVGDFFEHALWLCLDPQKYKGRCQCRHCNAEPAAAVARRSSQGVKLDAAGSDPWQSYSETWSSSAFMRVWGSNLDRQQEITPAVVQGHISQILRIHEICWLKLDEPIYNSSVPTMAITHWPVYVRSRRLMSGALKNSADGDIIMEESEESGDGTTTDYDIDDFELDGRVLQAQLYHIYLLGLRHESLVANTALVPYMSYRPPPELLAASLRRVEFAHVEWLRLDKRPKWQIVPTPDAPEGSEERLKLAKRSPIFHEALPAFYLAISIAGYASTAVVGTGQYTIDHEAVFPYKASHAQPGLRRELIRSIKEDWIIPKRNLWPKMGPLNADYKTIGNSFFQGVMLGTERVWTADVVRLDLEPSDRARLQKEIRERGVGLLTEAELSEVMKLRRAILMDLDAIVLPSAEGLAKDERNLLFCGRLWVALHRRRDGKVIDHFANIVKDTPFSSAQFSMEWTRPRNSLLYTSKMPVPSGMAFLPLMDSGMGHVAALPLTYVAGRWHIDADSLNGDDASLRSAYDSLMAKVEGAASMESTGSGLVLNEAERTLVLGGWAPGIACAMRAKCEWDTLYEVHETSDWTAKVELCEMLAQESEWREQQERQRGRAR
ncbi:hypothetical protein V8E36_002623 [Tilletia maclaganii]